VLLPMFFETKGIGDILFADNKREFISVPVVVSEGPQGLREMI
jgi:hypothetical protein